MTYKDGDLVRILYNNETIGIGKISGRDRSMIPNYFIQSLRLAAGYVDEFYVRDENNMERLTEEEAILLMLQL